MELKIKWVNPNTSNVTIKVYRGTSQLSKAALPAAIATITEPGVTEWIDTTAVWGVTYYYLIETTNGTNSVYSGNYQVMAGPKSGVGPSVLISGDLNLGYFGELQAGTLPSPTTIANMLGISVGNVNNRTGTGAMRWFKFARNGKILITSPSTMVYGVSWDHLYSKGLVYGVDGDGSSVDPLFAASGVGAVNQKVTINIGGSNYIVRTPSGLTESLTAAQRTALVGAATGTVDNLELRSEFDDLIAPLFQGYNRGSGSTGWLAAADLFRSWTNLYATASSEIGNRICRDIVSGSGGTPYITRRGHLEGPSNIATFVNRFYRAGSNATSSPWTPIFELVE